MSLKNRKDFHPSGATITHGDVEVQATEYIDVSEADWVRVVVSMVETAVAPGTGGLTVAAFGKLGNLETSIPFNFVTLTPNGAGPVIEGVILFDVRGYDTVRFKFSYSNAAADTVVITGQMGIPSSNPAR